jgi:hypothetical protein
MVILDDFLEASLSSVMILNDCCNQIPVEALFEFEASYFIAV